MSATDSIYQLMRHRVCRVLRVHWDPIGAQRMPTLPKDEYDTYAPAVLEIIQAGAVDPEVAAFLIRIESEKMGLGNGLSEARVPVVAAIRAALAEPTLPTTTNVDEFIEAAITRGQALGLDSLSALELRVFLISKFEVACDTGEIDSLLDNHPPSFVMDAASSFAWLGADHIAHVLRKIHRALPTRPDRDLGAACALITARNGYGYQDVVNAIVQWGIPC